MKSSSLKKSLSLIERMDKHFTLNELEEYILSDEFELMEYLWLRTNMTGLNVDIFVDDGGSYKRHKHKLLLFARNSYNHTDNNFIPFSIEQTPFVLDNEMEFNISYDDIFSIQDFIQNNLFLLQKLANKEISQNSFVNSLITVKDKIVVENKTLINEMATLRKSDSGLPVDVWIDEGGITTGHAPRLKFRANNDQRTTREYSSMLLTNPPSIENFPKNSPLRKKRYRKNKRFCNKKFGKFITIIKGRN